MIKIGFIDNFLSEWHANNYPQVIRENPIAKKLGMDVCYAYAKTGVSPYDGVTTDEWCEKFGVRKLGSCEELVEKSDVILVLSPDNPELHYELSEAALKSGKPTYIDKTFAPSPAEAERIFALAKEYGTPVYSSSSLRFAEENSAYRAPDVLPKSVAVIGPGNFEIYSIHIFEILCTLMKQGAQRICATQTGPIRSFAVDYGNGRSATFLQMEYGDNHPSVPYQTMVETADGKKYYHRFESNFLIPFCDALVRFFESGIPAVDAGETLDLMRMIEVGREALKHPMTWYSLKESETL